MTESVRNSRELAMALTNAKQTLSLLRSQARTGKVDASFVEQRLASVEQVLDELTEERKQTGKQERYARLYEVSRVIGASLDLQTVLDQVMDAIIQLTGAERGFLMLLNDDGNLDVKVARNLDQETLESSAFGFSKTVTKRVLETGQPIVTTNAQDDPRFAGHLSIVTQSLRSVMASPLRVREQVIGVVYVDNRVRTGVFSDDDLNVLDTFAGQAGIAIDNARLFGATDKALAARVEELMILQRMDRQLNETLNTRKIMQITLEWLSRSVQADHATMALLDADGLAQLAISYDGSQGIFSDSATIPLKHPLVQQAVQSHEAAWQESTSDSGAIYVLPIARENQVIGVISLLCGEDSVFNDNSRTMATRMADRAATSIENARLYDAVRAANQAKSEFVSVVAHELKVPMTSISGYADLMAVAGAINERQEQFVKTIKNAVHKMKVLVNDLSDISRIETGNMRVNVEDVNVVEAVNSALESTLGEIEQRQHQLVVDLTPELPPVQADRDRLVQVLVNLTSNAYKYTPNGGHIYIRALVAPERRIAISVQDSGVGMSAEQLANLGRKFWRADNGLEQSGTGLGFAITRNLIELMKGTLDIQSQPGQGSVFTFTLPIAQ
ncbi:MAG: GAF domain-containing sensor histidine kinase [Anaerolineae bacterium]|nr:GAF domain-containing sensor histidine kinase [Anaerolineae bacterium]